MENYTNIVVSIIQPGKGMKINLSDGKIHAYDFELKADNNILITSYGTEDQPYIKVANDLGKSLLFISKDEFYLQSPNYQDNSKNNGRGLRFDINKGEISAYSGFQLEAYKEGENRDTHFIKIDSTEVSHPFSIGNKFYISWDGTVTAKNIVIMGGQVYDSKGTQKDVDEIISTIESMNNENIICKKLEISKSDSYNFNCNANAKFTNKVIICGVEFNSNNVPISAKSIENHIDSRLRYHNLIKE